MSDKQVEQVLAFLKKWVVPAASVLGISVVLWGVFSYTVKSEIESAVAGMRTDVATMKPQVSALETGLGKTNEKIDNLLKEALERAFPKPSPTATKAELKEDFKRVDDLLQLAKSENVRLNPQLLVDYGKQVISVGNDRSITGAAWTTLGTLLNYRSFLNASMAPIPSDLIMGQSDFAVEFKAARLPNSSAGMLGVTYSRDAKMVSGEQAALFVQIGHEGKVVRGPNDFVVEGQGFNIILDGFHVRNAIVRNAEITYNGGPIILENVYFVNCTFKTTIAPSSQLFADALLEHIPATFSHS